MGIFGSSANGVVGRSQGLQQRLEAIELPVGETGTYVAGIAQAVGSVHAEHEGPDAARAASLAACEARDHELLAALQLQLAPFGRAASGPIRRVELLGDDTLEPVIARGALECCSVVERRREEDTGDRGVEEPLEHLAAFRIRAGDERLTVQLEHVERDEDERAGALLEQSETRASGLVEGTDLTVEHRGG